MRMHQHNLSVHKNHLSLVARLGFRSLGRITKPDSINNAPTVVFIASTGDDFSKLDCGLLGENMILSAWSMGIGSCCLGGPVAFLKSEKGAPFLEKLNFSEGYTLLYSIAKHVSEFQVICHFRILAQKRLCH